jgi:hypothetical protein
MLFDGASFGPTIEVAIQGAILDAEVSASAYQLFTCELVGEPQIFPGPNPEWGRNFRAQGGGAGHIDAGELATVEQKATEPST